jgi:hypothetical protein
MTTVTEKLADIASIVGSDGVAFINIRFALESIEQQELDGELSAAEIMQIVDRFHRLVMSLSK